MMMAGDDFRSQVLQATDIVQLISESVALKRRGKDYVGLCPFHSEKTPSFHVSLSKQFFHCYGCKESGNAIDFVIKRDRMDFIEALKWLGDRAGLEMPRRNAAGGKEQASQRQLLLDAHSVASSFFQKLLKTSSQGQKAKTYLAERGFNQQSIQQFQLGVSPDAWDELFRELGRKFAMDLLATAGLVKRRESGDGCYDTFRNRLIFPIRDERGRVIAFGGRVMPGSDDPAKYLNSTETPLFNKSQSIFGLDLARQRIVETRTAVVVEGYADVVMAHQHGLSNVVSVLGTALTEQHVTVLSRFADKIILLFDGDTAGDKAVDKAVNLFLHQPIEIAIASLPSGVDPDEFLLEHGAEAFNVILSKAKDALDYKWHRLQQQLGDQASTLTGRQRAVNDYLSAIASARGSGPVDAVRWGQILIQLRNRTGLTATELNQRFGIKAAPASAGRRHPQPIRHDDTRQLQSGSQQLRTAQDRAQRWLLGTLLIHPHYWQQVQQQVQAADFTDQHCQQLADIYWAYQRNEGEPVFNELLALLDSSALKQLAVELVDEAETLPDPQTTVCDALQHFVLMKNRRQEQELLAALHRNEQDAQATESPSIGLDMELTLLRQLQEKARQPDLRRVGFS